ncbi:MAG: hypothetical protein LC117_10460 [Bacteroidia bacterium]|nr:hypothetical protein [Bacteroidia bacterium]
MEQIDYIANLVTIIGLPLGIITLVIGILSIQQSKRIEQGKFLIELRNMFPMHNEVHFKLRPMGEWQTGKIPKDNETWAKIDAYLGLFELCEILIQNETLTETHFIDQYKYRLENILRNKQIRTEKLVNEKPYWKTLLQLKERMKIK